MPANVEGFVHGRLTMAREARALRQKELAELVDRVPGTVSKWENPEYQQTPEPATVSKLAEALGVEVDWFFKPLAQQSEAAVFYRSLKGEFELLRNKAQARLGFVEAIEEAISEYVDLPTLDIPDILDGRDIFSVRLEDIDRYADTLRDHWSLSEGPIFDLMVLVENAGVVVAEDEIGTLKLDGVSRWSAATDKPYILLAKDKRVGVRRRFDLAHELGHVVLHKHVSKADLINHFSLIEDQAMAFAGAFLMPAREFSDDIFSFSLDVMIQSKAKWQVSVGAMIKRLSNLGRISEEYERKLWQYYSARRWRGNEPLDDSLPIENPQNLRSSIEMIIDGDAATPNELRREIGLSAADVCGLAGLSADYFEPRSPNVVRLIPQPRYIEQETTDTKNNSKVVFISGHKGPKQ